MSDRAVEPERPLVGALVLLAGLVVTFTFPWWAWWLIRHLAP